MAGAIPEHLIILAKRGRDWVDLILKPDQTAGPAEQLIIELCTGLEEAAEELRRGA